MSDDDPQESFISHLVELRDRLLRSVIVFLIILLIAFLDAGAGLDRFERKRLKILLHKIVMHVL